MKGKIMEIPYVKGITTKQAHVDIPAGLFEEEMGRNGFFGKYVHFYRRNAPVGWTHIEGPLRPQCFDLNKIDYKDEDYLRSRRRVLYNQDVCLYSCRLVRPMTYYFRNADGDEVFFVHKGRGILETDFGRLDYEEGDYLLIPRGTTYRINNNLESEFLIIESFSEIHFPDRGMLGQHALFDPSIVKTPELSNGFISSLEGSQEEYELKIKRRNQFTRVFYPFCPLDAQGWKGTLSVLQLNVRDIRPVSSDRYHLPPSAHSTFVARNFVICTFLPRPLEVGDDKAMKVPFYHSNIDFDEVLFYHSGEFFSRSGIKEGMLTFHPQGIHHGPQSGAIERTKEAKFTNEVAVMIDTKNPLDIDDKCGDFEEKNYWRSWQTK